MLNKTLRDIHIAELKHVLDTKFPIFFILRGLYKKRVKEDSDQGKMQVLKFLPGIAATSTTPEWKWT